ncbi:MAG TPA: hypothetical protein VKQ73_13545 [Stellaceae bacterium]|nr:hypothetical protein [Stellaceae bacterium]
MDCLDSYTPLHSGQEPATRSFLFLQGPISSFFDRLGRALIARGHHVHRINLHFGDQLFWRLPASHFRGRFEDWRGFVGDLLERHKVTDLVLHGDRRPYHIVAAEEARARGIRVIATDLGYVRPDWITLECDGMTTYSRFPRDPAAIQALAATCPEPQLGPRFHTPFWLIAVLDILYNLGLVFGRPFYPHYRYHSICHPFVEYAGWLWSRPRKLLTAGATAAAKRRLQASPRSYFLVPLQISTDFQIRAHSRFRDVREAVRTIIASFAESGSGCKLVFVVHPLDNGLIGWNRLIASLAREHGIAQQVVALLGGTPIELLCNAAGIVTINSTVGVTALHHGVPVKTLGNAVFDIAGMTCQAPLDAFWRDPPAPDPQLTADFLRALVATTQVKGGYYQRASRDCAIAGVVERLEGTLYPLPALTPQQFAARPPRGVTRTVAVVGIADRVSVALARAYAAPGVRLYLVGRVGPLIEQAAADCRHRGALVETTCVAPGDALPDRLAGLDPGAAVDVLAIAGAIGIFAVGDAIAPDVLAAMDAVAALATPMRRRGRGEIVLIGGLGGRRPASTAQAARAVAAFVAYGAALGRRLRRDGVSLTVAAPDRATIGADRLAELIVRRRPSRYRVIAVPGRAAVAWRAIGVGLARLRDAAHDLLLPNVAALGDKANKAPLPGESGPGD